MNLITEIKIKNYPEENTPIINVFDDNISYLLIDEWPMENENKFSKNEINNFEEILSELLGVEVIQEDRDRFVILTSDLQIIKKLQFYLENKS